ncbi:MAG: AI-2E family transporter [Sphingomonadales bacterium]|nr:AI-2E family transporter [Sphingomonadales bacterium]
MARHPSPVARPGSFFRDGDHRPARAQTFTGGAAILLLAVAGLWTLHAFLPALGWGVIFAVSLWPLFERCAARWPAGRRLAWPAAFTLLILLAFVLPLLMVTLAAIRDGAMLVHWVAEARAQGIAVPAFVPRLPFGPQLASWWQATLATPARLDHLSLHAGPGGASPLATGQRIVSALAHRLLITAFMLLVLFMLLRDGERVVVAVRIGGRRAFGESGENIAAQAVLAIRGVVNGLVIVGFGEAVLMGIAYALAGVSQAALLGLLTGLLSAIPFGAMVAVVIAAGLLVVTGQFAAAAVIFATGALVVFLADHFVRPVFIGGATRLPFLWVLLGILGGVEAWGLIGLVLGPALIAVLMLLWREWVGAVPGPLNPPRAAAEPSARS